MRAVEGGGSRSGGCGGGGEEWGKKDNGGGKQQEQQQQHMVAPHEEFGESEAHLLRTDHHPYGGFGGPSHLKMRLIEFPSIPKLMNAAD